MLSFVNDYSQGAHEAILNRLLQINPETIARGYGADHYCESAKEKIRAACESPAADVFFLTGGTQTNAVVMTHCWTLMRGLWRQTPVILACTKQAPLSAPGIRY